MLSICDYVSPDGIHLTESGKQAFATMLADAVQAKVNASSPKKSGKSGKSGKKKSRKSSGELPDSDKIVSEEHMQIDTIRIARAVAQRFPEIETIGGWRPYDAYPDHPSGRAADIMIPHWDTEEGKNSVMRSWNIYGATVNTSRWNISFGGNAIAQRRANQT